MKNNSRILIVIAIFCTTMPGRISAQAEPPANVRRYTVIDLGTLGGTFSFATGINNKGLVNGFSTMPGDVDEHAFLWRDGALTDLGTFGGPNSGVSFWGRRANERGEVVGAAQTNTPDPAGEDYCQFINNSGFENPAPFQCLPFVWQNGAMTPLTTLGGNGSAAQVNNRGQVAGQVDGPPDCAPGTPHPIPVVWENGVRHQLPTLPGFPYGGPNAMNDNGQSAGVLVGACSGSPAHAVLWDRRGVKFLGSLGGQQFDEAADINNRGQAVGFSSIAGDTSFHGFFWSEDSGMQDLGTLSGDVSSIAVGINDKGQIVGFSCQDAACASPRAFLLTSGTMLDLNTLLSSSNLFLAEAFDINAQGQIVGLAMDTTSGQFHAFLATPCGDEAGNSQGCVGSAEGTAAARQLQRPTLPENLRRQLANRLGFGAPIR